MKYRVRLYKDRLVPYEVDVSADCETTAIEKAKDIVANIGYCGNETKDIEKIKSMLVVEFVKRLEI